MINFQPQHLDRIRDLTGRELAPFSKRAIAFIIDFLTAFTIFTVVVIFGAKMAGMFGLINNLNNYQFQFDLKHWYSILAVVLYFGVTTFLGKGQSPGKRVMRIRVISLTHNHLSLWHCTERALGYGASALELGFGFFQYFIHPNKQTVHDRIAETIVVIEKKQAD